MILMHKIWSRLAIFEDKFLKKVMFALTTFI